MRLLVLLCIDKKILQNRQGRSYAIRDASKRRKKKNKNTVENLSTRDNKLELVESKMANDGYISMWV